MRCKEPAWPPRALHMMTVCVVPKCTLEAQRPREAQGRPKRAELHEKQATSSQASFLCAGLLSGGAVGGQGSADSLVSTTLCKA